MNPIGDREIGILSQWLTGISRRQDAISNNIANIDTPGYQRQEVPFETQLQREIGTTGSQLATTDPRHITAGSRLRGALGIAPDQLLTSSRLDGNNVDIDQEMISLSDTQMRYQAASTALTRKIGILRTAIGG
ncbi:MAG: flagellar basal body rod protein FlgB [Dehalococcoidia bacterium]|nr:flagellar basal body rod protein FlgB [Dehalococcoidia bacterium]